MQVSCGVLQSMKLKLSVSLTGLPFFSLLGSDLISSNSVNRFCFWSENSEQVLIKLGFILQVFSMGMGSKVLVMLIQ